MKTFRIITCLFAVVCGIVTVSAEEFFPTGTTWTEAWFTPDMLFDDATVSTYEVGTDTIIGEKTYRKIYVDGQEQGLWIREEEGKLLLLRDDFPQEIMLYNFDWYSYSEYKWKSDCTTTYQYTTWDGELKEDTIHYSTGWTSAMEDNKERPCISFWSSYLGAEMIRGIGRLTEPVLDCCILGSRMPDVIPPGLDQCRLLTFTRGGKLIYDYKKQFEGYELFTRGVPTAGIDVYFSATWHRMIRMDYCCLDSISGHRVCISAHYNRLSDESETNRRSPILLNFSESGEYTVILSAVDDSRLMPDVVMEYPFTVMENPVDVPCGLIHTSGADEKQKSEEDAFEEGLITDRVTPVISATLEGDSLHITGWLRFQVSDHYCYYEIHADSVYLETVERNNSVVIGGWPFFSVDFKIGPFTAERCTLQVAHLLGRGNAGNTHYHSTHTFDFTTIRQLEENDVVSSGSFYDLTGRPADRTQKGIYIRNGKKVLVR